VIDYVMASVRGDELPKTSAPSVKMMLCVKECLCKLVLDVPWSTVYCIFEYSVQPKYDKDPNVVSVEALAFDGTIDLLAM
jgi:hypothetical protein